MGRKTVLMKEFVEKSGPPPSGLILDMMAEELGGSWPTIIWLWSGAFTSIRPTVADGGQGLGRLPEDSITSSCAWRLETFFTCRSPKLTVCTLIKALFRGVYSFSWAEPEQGGRVLLEGWAMWAEVPAGDGTEACWPARLGDPG